jgi:hypothetical protein
MRGEDVALTEPQRVAHDRVRVARESAGIHAAQANGSDMSAPYASAR